MPKSILLQPLIAAMEGRNLKIASGLELATAFQAELQAFMVTRGEDGHLGYEGKGEHDDLVIAAALALYPQ